MTGVNPRRNPFGSLGSNNQETGMKAGGAWSITRYNAPRRHVRGKHGRKEMFRMLERGECTSNEVSPRVKAHEGAEIGDFPALIWVIWSLRLHHLGNNSQGRSLGYPPATNPLILDSGDQMLAVDG